MEWPRNLLKGSDLDHFGGVGVKIGKTLENIFGGCQHIISSMHRLRKVICYIIIPLGVA